MFLRNLFFSLVCRKLLNTAVPLSLIGCCYGDDSIRSHEIEVVEYSEHLNVSIRNKTSTPELLNLSKIQCFRLIPRVLQSKGICCSLIGCILQQRSLGFAVDFHYKAVMYSLWVFVFSLGGKCGIYSLKKLNWHFESNSYFQPKGAGEGEREEEAVEEDQRSSPCCRSVEFRSPGDYWSDAAERRKLIEARESESQFWLTLVVHWFNLPSERSALDFLSISGAQSSPAGQTVWLLLFCRWHLFLCSVGVGSLHMLNSQSLDYST